MSQVSRIINVPATGSGGINILGSVLSRRYILTESTTLANGTANTPQGLVYIDQTPVNSGGVAAPALPLAVNNSAIIPAASDESFHEASGRYLSNGPGVLVGVGPTAALPLCNVVSATATATAVVVTEIV